MGEMSKVVEAVYRVLFEEMKFAKRQQWTVSNYMLLLLAAIFGVGATLKSTIASPEKHVLSVLVVFIVGAGWYFLIDLQRYLTELRERIQDIEATFDEVDQDLLQVREYKSPGRRGLPFTAMMIAAITVAGVVVTYGVWRL